ncbi:MAG: FHA domain-containing protein [Planctomycetaceae bacterium]
MNIVIRITTGPGTGTCRVVNLGQKATIGASATCDWVLEDASDSEAQFSIECTRLGCWVEGRSKVSGLKVNGIATNRRKLCDGDIITLGACSFIARIRGQHNPLQAHNIPLVGTEEFAQRFSRSVSARLSGTWTRSMRKSTVQPITWRKSLSGQ